MKVSLVGLIDSIRWIRFMFPIRFEFIKKFVSYAKQNEERCYQEKVKCMQPNLRVVEILRFMKINIRGKLLGGGGGWVNC